MMVEELIEFVRARHAGLTILVRPGNLTQPLFKDLSIIPIRAMVPEDEENTATANRKILEQQAKEQRALRGWEPPGESELDKLKRLQKEGDEWEGQTDVWISLKGKVERRLNSVTRSEFAPSWGVMDDFEKVVALAASRHCDLEFTARADGEYHVLIATAPNWGDPNTVVEDYDLHKLIQEVGNDILKRRV
jgi:hypothetical protein